MFGALEFFGFVVALIFRNMCLKTSPGREIHYLNKDDCAWWVNIFGLTYPVLYDLNFAVWNNYKSEEAAIPLNLVIDRDFIIRYKSIGYRENEIRSAIEEYL